MFTDIYYFLQVWAQYTRRCKVLVTLIDHSHSVCVSFLKKQKHIMYWTDRPSYGLYS